MNLLWMTQNNPRRKRLFRYLGISDSGGSVDGEYGVEWDYSNPSPKLTRTGDAASFADPVPATSLAGSGSSPFDGIMPWAGMRMCNIINGEVVYWQGDPQFSETDYDTMVFIPEFWYKAEKNTDAHKWNWSISPTEREGYVKHPGSGRYVGRFHTSGDSTAVFSKSGVAPLANTSRSNFRTYSHNKGAKWWMLDLASWSAIQILYLVEFANFNSQVKLGTGQDSGSLSESGRTAGAAYHTIKRSKDSNQYRWLENPFSNLYNWVDGFLAVDRKTYVGTDNSAFGDTVASLVATGITLPSTNQYISGFGYSAVCPWAFLPDSVWSSTSPEYVTDRQSATSGTMALAVGGGFMSSEICGMYYFGANQSAPTEGPLRGSRLIYIP